LFGIPILFQVLAKSTNLSQKSGFVESSKYPFSLANLRCAAEKKLVRMGFNFPFRDLLLLTRIFQLVTLTDMKFLCMATTEYGTYVHVHVATEVQITVYM